MRNEGVPFVYNHSYSQTVLMAALADVVTLHESVSVHMRAIQQLDVPAVSVYMCMCV